MCDKTEVKEVPASITNKEKDVQNKVDSGTIFSSDRTSISLRIHCKAIFFFIYSIIGTINNFQNVYLVSIGFTESQAGLMTGMCFIASTAAGPCWGTLADRTGYRKVIFTVLCTVVLITFFPLPLIARELQISICSHHHCNYSRTVFLGVDMNRNGTSNATHTHINSLLSSSPIFFNTVAVILIIGYTCLFTLMSFVDSTTMNVLETMKSKEGYGHQRMFGALGIGVTTLLAGYAVDQFEHPSLSKYTAIYLVLFPYLLISLPLTLFVFRYTNWEIQLKEDEMKLTANDEYTKSKNKTSSTNYENENIEVKKCTEEEKALTDSIETNLLPTSQLMILRDIFSKVDNVFMMTTTLVVGTVRSIFFGFIFLIIKDEMGGSRSSMGLSMFANSISAFIMFFYTKRFIEFLGGPFIAVAIGVFTWAVRLFLSSVLKNQWWLAVPQLLQAFSFALFWAAMVQHVHSVTTKEVYITMFTILTSLNFGAAGFLGNVIGGKLYKMYGGPVLFRGTAAFALCWFVVILLYHYRWIFFNKSDRSKATEEDLDDVKNNEGGRV